jgi:hypothetical protein
MDEISAERFALTINEFCTQFRVGRSYTYQEIAAGRLRVRKAGRRTIILQLDALDWAKSLPTKEGAE